MELDRSQLINSDNYIFIGGVLTGYANPVMHMRTDGIRGLAIYMRDLIGRGDNKFD